MTVTKLPLAGIKVLDLSRILAGPWCTMTLADLGADVIKVEHPERGDDTRGWSPFVNGESAYFLFVNRNKRSVTLDIADAGVQDLLRAYVLEADILVENYRPGALVKYRLDYESARALNPRLIYCSVTGYGHASPMAERPGYDFVIQAEGGVMSVTGDVDGLPLKAGVPIADLLSGMNATQAVLAALIARDRYGIGQHIDIALLDGQVSAMMNVASEHLLTGLPSRRYANAHPSVVPYQAFTTADAHIVVAAGNDAQFTSLCRNALERPELALDERFKTNGSRVTHRDVLVPMLAEIIRGRSTEHWVAALTRAGVPNGKIRKVEEALASNEVIARDMIWQVAHPAIGDLKIVGSPLKMSATPVRRPAAPPTLGQHTNEVLSEAFGLTNEEIERLHSRGVTGPRRPLS